MPDAVRTIEHNRVENNNVSWLNKNKKLELSLLSPT